MIKLRCRTFEEKLEKYALKGNTEDECWDWNNKIDQTRGYPRIACKIDGKKVTKNASRVSYEKYYGPIPEKLLVCHKCDNPSCTNPKHLFLGTSQDNMTDMKDKNRQRRGETVSRSRLKTQDVLNIREEYQPYKVTAQELSEKYGVSCRHIFAIIYKEKWTHV